VFGIDNYTQLWTSTIVAVIIVFAVYFFKESRIGLRLRARETMLTPRLQLASTWW